ncbi:MAG: phosphatase [Candidatus Kapabacteria bacterium]|nr:phosphatase [Candidatus Kapabacteria bacterium]
MQPTEPVVIAADLHTHTTCSDGVRRPDELVAMAEQAGLQFLGIADHDTVEAHHVLRKGGYNGPIRIMPAIELSCFEHQREIHVLGYCFDIDNADVLAYAAAKHIERYERAAQMVERLRRFGNAITIDEVVETAAGAPIGRPHIAAVLVKRGFVRSIQDAFDTWLDSTRPAYVTRPTFTVAEGVRLIRNAGGFASIAHPMRTFADPRLFLQLMASGINGVEVFHPSHYFTTREYYRVLAKQHGLMITGGSDFHGTRDYDERNFGKFGLTSERVDALLESVHARNLNVRC